MDKCQGRYGYIDNFHLWACDGESFSGSATKGMATSLAVIHSDLTSTVVVSFPGLTSHTKARNAPSSGVAQVNDVVM